MAGLKYYEILYDEEGNAKVSSPTNLPTPDEVRKKWCFGLPLTKEDGEVMPDEDILLYLESAISEVERQLGVYLKPTVVATNPEEQGYVKGKDYDVYDAPYDYNARMYRQYGFLQLRHRPIRRLYDFKMVLPNGMIIIDFMTRPEWIKLYQEEGQIHIVPYAGDPTLFAMLGGTQSGYPFATGRINSNLPQMFYTRYETGFELGEIPAEVRNVVAKIASIDMLGIAGDAILAGVASMSTSIDGLSESMSTTASATNATYGARILQLQKEVDKFFSKGSARSYYRGITMTGL